MWNWLEKLLGRKKVFTGEGTYYVIPSLEEVEQGMVEEAADAIFIPNCFKCSELWSKYFRVANSLGDRNRIYSNIQRHQAGSRCTRNIYNNIPVA